MRRLLGLSLIVSIVFMAVACTTPSAVQRPSDQDSKSSRREPAPTGPNDLGSSGDAQYPSSPNAPSAPYEDPYHPGGEAGTVPDANEGPSTSYPYYQGEPVQPAPPAEQPPARYKWRDKGKGGRSWEALPPSE